MSNLDIEQATTKPSDSNTPVSNNGMQLFTFATMSWHYGEKPFYIALCDDGRFLSDATTGWIYEQLKRSERTSIKWYWVYKNGSIEIIDAPKGENHK